MLLDNKDDMRGMCYLYDVESAEVVNKWDWDRKYAQISLLKKMQKIQAGAVAIVFATF